MAREAAGKAGSPGLSAGRAVNRSRIPLHSHPRDMARLVIVKTGSTMPALKASRGDFEDWIVSGMGIDRSAAEVVDGASGQALPRPDACAGIVVTGSHDMVTDRSDWSERTAAWLAQSVALGVPILGICYGHQLLAHALGGAVGFNPRGRELGTTEVDLLAPALRDALLGGLPARLKVHASHSQSVLRLPTGAIRLAGNAWDRNHAFRVGERAWGVQFHPEFDAEVMRAYAAAAKRDAHVEEAPDSTLVLRRFAGQALGVARA